MLVRIFEDQVQRHPDQIAVKVSGRQLTYREINHEANRIARSILQTHERELTQERPTVALLFEHGTDMITAMMGALKTALIYTPLDPSYPEKRLMYMVENAEAGMIVTNTHNLDLARRIIPEGRTDLTILNIDEIDLGTSQENLAREIADDQIAYILYTSGSTGNPKGVIQTHRNIWHFIVEYTKSLALTSKDRLTLFSAFSHDAAVMDIYGGLLNGATLYPLNIKNQVTLTDLAHWLNEEEITIWHSVPTVYRFFMGTLAADCALPHLRYMVLGGEGIRKHDVQIFQKHFTQTETTLINLYGQSESSYNSTQYIRADERFQGINLGELVGETTFLVVNEEGEEVDLLKTGEIVVLSDYLALGYWKNPDKTEEVFMDDPDLGRMYFTGDLGRLRHDGTVEYIGRKDFQVKIRGYRVELGEIESHLLQHPAIRETAVVAREDLDGNYELAAFIVPNDTVAESTIRAFLANHLPEYMIPMYFVTLDALPLTPNNKLDRKALLEYNLTLATSEEYLPPTNEVEEKLVTIWEELLGKQQIGIADNFFQRGGHSLKATQLIARIHQTFKVEVPLRTIFETPTIRELALFIESAEETSGHSLTEQLAVIRQTAATRETAADREMYPVSSAQKRLYILHQLNPISTSYNMPQMFVLPGQVETREVETVFQQLIERHESLRTSFEFVENEPVQWIHKDVDFALTDLGSYTLNNQAEQAGLIDRLFGEFVQPFDLRNAPLFRAAFARLGDKTIFFYDTHHIISDGTSSVILRDEFLQLSQGRKLPPLPLQYKDYAIWQNAFLASEEMQGEKVHWLQTFSGELPILNMPTDYPRPPVMTNDGALQTFALDEAGTARLRKLALETGTTLYMVLLGAYNLLLARYTGQEDIIVGSPIAGRPHVDLERMIGMFVNTLAMRNRPIQSRSFTKFLADVKENVLQAFKHQNYPFELLVEKLHLERDLSRNPLFDTMFVMQNMQDLHHLEAHPTEDAMKTERRVARFDLTFTTYEIGKNLHFTCEYNTRLFKQETIHQMTEHFLHLLNEVATQPDRPMAEMEMLSPEEKAQLIHQWNDTATTYPAQRTVHQLFEEQVARSPEACAVAYDGQTLTYRELNARANQLARTLRDRGVKPNSMVGLLVGRSLEMMVGIFAILKAGGAYLPIHPNYPAERIHYMLEDSGAEIVLTHEHLAGQVPFDGQILTLEEIALYQNEDPTQLEAVQSASDLAYVIYTSGSTGLPKGVMISHRALTNFIYSYYDDFDQQIGVGDRGLSLANICFDASVSELFIPLLFGATLVLFNNDAIPDIHKLARTIIDEEITLAFVPPTLLKDLYTLLQPEKEQVKLNKMMVGVEAIQDYVLEDFMSLREDMQILNGYGPTEATICAVNYKYMRTTPSGRNVPIGKPLANTQIYILDSYHHLLPIGVPGELCIAGDGLAEGYLGKPELTAEKFVQNPFFSDRNMYKTGDLARWLPDGNLEFRGRIDQQVKIRGFRIEPGEIENQLLQYEPIKEAIVIVRVDPQGTKYLCAYLVATQEVTVGELREYLLKKLPEYMIPSYFVQLEEIPLTPNGKVDRKALPEPEGNIVTGTRYVAPRNEIEEILAAIWSEILGVPRVGMEDHFFELGGHSLKATVLVGRIHKEFDVEVPLSEVFRTPTIQGISAYIQNANRRAYESIKKASEKEYYEASSAQKRMYMLHQFDVQSVGYNIPGILCIKGSLDLGQVEATFHELIQRHETLRTSFMTIDEKIVQKVHPQVEFQVEYFETNEQTVDAVVQEFIRPFHLNQAPLVRVGVIRQAEDQHILMFDMHHIISDGMSMGILVKEFATLYEGQNLEPLKIQYKDFAEWQHKLLYSDVMKKQEEYWLHRFSGEIPSLNLPTDYPRPTIQSFEGDRIWIQLGKELTQGLDQLAKETGSTMYMVLLAGVNVLLSKYSGQDDIIIGSPIAGRPHADLQKIIGVFVNTLAMRNHPVGDKSFEEFLREVRESALEAYEHQDYQFEEIVDKLNLRRNLSRNPLFDIMFVLQNTDQPESRMKDVKIAPYRYESNTSKFDLTIAAAEVNDNLTIHFEFCKKLFQRETVERMSRHLKKILSDVVADPKLALHTIQMITEEETNQLLYEWNATTVDYPREKTIQELFAEQVEAHPDKTAIVVGDQRLTYSELDARAHALAVRLRLMGVKAETVVGIVAESSPELIVGVLAILKAGGAYLPIDPEYPDERIQLMLADASVSVLLTQGEFQRAINYPCSQVNLLDPNLYMGVGKDLLLHNQNTPNSLAYVIYTSGSTGKPKGVMVEHRNIIRLVKNTNYIHFQEDDAILQTGTLAFDASTFEIWGALLHGLELHLGVDILQAQIMETYIREQGITILWLTAPLFNILAEERPEIFTPLRYLLVGGDVLSPRHINKVRRACKQLNMVNGYGPTENTTFSTTFLIDREYAYSIPIGKPINNATAYVLDPYNHLSPIGIYGELCVGGDGLARGYLQNPELTAEKFVDNPWFPGERMYRTGDLVRWLPDGNIEFFGRLDHQVKIRGFRIELGEIENCLLRANHVKEVVVIDRMDDKGNKYLCAYIVVQGEVSANELRTYLADNLPNYMIPSYFVQLDQLPLTPNGKVDRAALPEPAENLTMGVEFVAPANEVEETLVAIWSDILGIAKVSVNAHFFELGGHSLKATVLAARIQKEFDVELSLSQIFKTPTIREIGHYIQNATKTPYRAITKVEEKDEYQASPAQKRMYMLQQFALQSTGYNIPAVMEIKGYIELERLENAFKGLIQRHETLRTSFANIDDRIVQRIHAEIPFAVEYTDDGDRPVEEVVKAFVRPFDLSKAPLFRVGLIKLEDERHILMFDMHHVISDGTSMAIVVKEFVSLYEGQPLEPLRIQYKDFAEWQSLLLQSDEMKKQEEYWLQRFCDEIPVLNLPSDRPRPTIQSFEGDRIGCTLDLELSKGLKELAKESGSTLYMVLLAGINVFLSKYSGQDDIIVGSPIAGRPHADLQKIIGMFVNTLAMRNHPTSDKTFAEFLQEVRDNALVAYENQDYQFEEIVDQLSLRRDLSRNPLFDVMFVLQNTDRKGVRMNDVTLTPYRYENKTSKFDLTISASEMSRGIVLSMEYSTRLFQEASIQRMITHLQRVLQIIVSNPTITLREIDMLTDEERSRILTEWNNTRADYPADQTIHTLFEAQVEREPERIAAIFEGESITYGELNAQANHLARTLRQHRVQADNVVGIMAERSLEMIIGIFGILKAGGAYLPIDPGYPADRIQFMLEDSNSAILLTQRKWTVEIPYTGTVLYLDEEAPYTGAVRNHGEESSYTGTILNHDQETSYLDTRSNLESISRPRDLAYIIYTSGSTGKPKGVMIEHHSVLNRLNWMQRQYPIGVEDTILQKTPYTFDVSVWEIFWWALQGARVVFLAPGGEKDPETMVRAIEEHQVTIMHFVPSMLHVFLEYVRTEATMERLTSLRRVFASGEALPRQQVEVFNQSLHQAHGTTLHNLYGPTEATVDVTFFDCLPDRDLSVIPIGKPIDNTRIYILDRDQQWQPIGVPGELCIAGVNLARGYLQRPELTAERFVLLPSGERVYRTGDLARWMPDGQIEYLGRMDHQVKIRGFRIETGEIEAALATYPAMREVVVVDGKDENGSYLCAYLVIEGEPVITELREHLAKTLPYYMIPAHFVKLDQLPLTPNGKLDRKALPKPDGSLRTRHEQILPRNEIEGKLAQIWSMALGKEIETIGIHDSFFDLGGNSISLLKLNQMLNTEFGKEFVITDLFRYNTIEELAATFESDEEDDDSVKITF